MLSSSLSLSSWKRASTKKAQPVGLLSLSFTDAPGASGRLILATSRGCAPVVAISKEVTGRCGVDEGEFGRRALRALREGRKREGSERGGENEGFHGGFILLRRFRARLSGGSERRTDGASKA